MKKLILSALVVNIFFAITIAQIPTGKVVDNLNIKSNLLKKEVRYSVYLPPDYETSNRSYPVVYLLHGFSDNQWGWIQFGEVNFAADKAIADRKIPPMIIVMPDAEVTWYVNDYKGINPYEDMFFKEFIPTIEATYRIRAKKEFRAICGLSMGGYGSLIYTLHHPEMFAVCAPFSAAVFTDNEMETMNNETYKIRFGNIYGNNLLGNDRISVHWKNNDVLNLVKQIPEKEKNNVRYYIDCGDDDFLFKGNSALHTLMRDLNIPHEYRVRNGDHNWTYWRTGIADALEFIGDSFRR